MPRRAVAARIPANATLTTSIQFDVPARTVKLLHYQSRTRTMHWLVWRAEYHDDTPPQVIAEQRTGRRATDLPAELAQTVRDMEADGATVTVLLAGILQDPTTPNGATA